MVLIACPILSSSIDGTAVNNREFHWLIMVQLIFSALVVEGDLGPVTDRERILNEACKDKEDAHHHPDVECIDVGNRKAVLILLGDEG